MLSQELNSLKVLKITGMTLIIYIYIRKIIISLARIIFGLKLQFFIFDFSKKCIFFTNLYRIKTKLT